MDAIFVEMQREHANKSTGFEEALGALLKMLFIRSERIYQQANTNIDPGRSSALMREFRLGHSPGEFREGLEERY